MCSINATSGGTVLPSIRRSSIFTVPFDASRFDSIRRYKTRYTTAAVPRLLTRQWPCSMAKKAFRFISDKPFFLFIAVPTGFSAPRVFNSPASWLYGLICAFLVDRSKPGAVLSLRINHSCRRATLYMLNVCDKVNLLGVGVYFRCVVLNRTSQFAEKLNVFFFYFPIIPPKTRERERVEYFFEVNS